MSKSQLSKNDAKASKAIHIHKQAVLVNNVKSEIDMFGGNRTNARYKDLQKILATTSIKVQDLKIKTHKQHNRDYCAEILGDIQHCIQRLESKASFNGRKDLPAFTSEKLHLPELTLNEITEEENNECAWRLSELEKESDRLERDLRRLIELGDVRQLSYLEKRIRLIYKQLELVSAKNYTPLGDKKLAIGKKLIKCNNQIRKAKRNIKRTRNRINLSFRERSDNLVCTVEDQMTEIEAAVGFFEGQKFDARYSELQQSLEWQKINLHRVSHEDDELYHRTSLLIGKVDSLLLELEQKSERTENPQQPEGQELSTSSIDFIKCAETCRHLWNNIDKKLTTTHSNVPSSIANILVEISEELGERIKTLHSLNYSLKEGTIDPYTVKRKEEIAQHENEEEDGCKVGTTKFDDIAVDDHELIKKLVPFNSRHRSEECLEVINGLNICLQSISDNTNQNELKGGKGGTEYFEISNKHALTTKDGPNLKNKYTSVPHPPKSEESKIVKVQEEPIQHQIKIATTSNSGDINEWNEASAIIMEDKINQLNFQYKELETAMVQSTELEIIRSQLKILKSQIKRFDGNYHDPLYIEIEGMLNTCNQKLNEIQYVNDEKLHEAHSRIRKKIKNHMKLLQRKSVGPHYGEGFPKYTTNQNSSRMGTNLDQTETETRKEFKSEVKLSGEIDDVNNNSNVSKKHEIDESYRLAHTLEQTSESEKLYESKNQSVHSSKISDPLEDLAIVENKIAEIKFAIGELNASSPQDKLHQDNISQAIKSCVSDIDRIDAGNVAFVREQKRKMSGELRNYELLFRKKLQKEDEIHQAESNNIREILEKLSDVEVQINNFSGSKHDSVYNSLDERLVKLIVQLNSIKTYKIKKLEIDKNNGIQAIFKSIRVLAEKANSLY